MINSSILTSFVSEKLKRKYDGETCRGLPFNNNQEINIAQNVSGTAGQAQAYPTTVPVTHYLFSVILTKAYIRNGVFSYE